MAKVSGIEKSEADKNVKITATWKPLKVVAPTEVVQRSKNQSTLKISEIYFLGQKITFDFWLNKYFWNVWKLVRHIAEGFIPVLRDTKPNEIHLYS